MSNASVSAQTGTFASHLRPSAPKPRMGLSQLLTLTGAQLVKVGSCAPDPDGRDFHIRAEFLTNKGQALWAVGSILEIEFDQLKKMAPEMIGRAGFFYSRQGLTGPDGLLNRGWSYSVHSKEQIGGENWTITVQFHTPSGFRIEVRDLDARTLPSGMEIPGWLRFALRSRPPVPARPGKTARDHERGTAARSAAARATRSAITAASKGAPGGGGGKKGGKGK